MTWTATKSSSGSRQRRRRYAPPRCAGSLHSAAVSLLPLPLSLIAVAHQSATSGAPLRYDALHLIASIAAHHTGTASCNLKHTINADSCEHHTACPLVCRATSCLCMSGSWQTS
jgi:hypothetical protein